ncbi:MAG TPA: TIGR03118 family protein [Casimicrobiaceae bacterium]
MIPFSSCARRAVPATLMAAALLLSAPLRADPNNYHVQSLVSDGGVPAAHRDDNLKNGWGVAFNPTAFVWVADNGSGKSTLYDGNGVQQIPPIVTIPSADPSTHGTPTGITFNASNDFTVSSNGVSGPARFIFVSEDGMVSGWAPNVDFNNAIKGWLNPDAVYKGVALAGNGGQHFMLYAADFRGRKIDVYDSTFHPASVSGGFVDHQIPDGYGPFNIMNIEGNLYVAYAKKDPNSDDEAAGPGLGFVDVFDADGNLLKRLAKHGTLNAPWGMALAPAGFGKFSNRLLVGNFGDGAINAYDPRTGKFAGQLKSNGKVLKIDGLWGIAFGNGVLSQPTDTLFFAAGPNDEANGMYGRIDTVSPGDDQDDDNGDD